MKEELKIFLSAVMFYTRIPVPRWVGHSDYYLNKASRYFPVIGWIVGGAAGGVFWMSYHYFSKDVSIILSMAASALMTGAFHEDGFADVCDAFGGGWTKEKILAIMKDSRLGTYGVIGLIFILLLKFFLLREIAGVLLPAVLIIAHSLSRSAAIGLVFFYPYVSDSESSKAKPVGKKSPYYNLIILIVLGCLPLALAPGYWIWLTPVLLFAATWYLGTYYRKWIGGYTGDCLGAAQQVNEILVYLSLILILANHSAIPFHFLDK